MLPAKHELLRVLPPIPALEGERVPEAVGRALKLFVVLHYPSPTLAIPATPKAGVSAQSRDSAAEVPSAEMTAQAPGHLRASGGGK